MSGKNPFLGLGFGSPFTTFARASSSGGEGGEATLVASFAGALSSFGGVA